VKANKRAVDWKKWIGMVKGMVHLQEGWNGYQAPAPSLEAVIAAESFLDLNQAGPR
jgi:hypothetical protein